ncbi:hypothetical protein, partial [Nocardia paucivorans]|uniref:hypothetical protein n=1 Tax=Nocardia paucivorans TaxID=114259 RepID=UPI001C3F3B4A
RATRFAGGDRQSVAHASMIVDEAERPQPIGSERIPVNRCAATAFDPARFALKGKTIAAQ